MYTDAQAAQLAAMVMYGWDMCDRDLHCLSPSPDSRIIAAGWQVAGYITGGDKLIRFGNGIRRKVLDVCPQNADRVCYGYLFVTASVTVLGHSLGVVLATYLTAELVALLPASQVSACLFASPQPGDDNFASYFRHTVPHYQVFSYQNDIVSLVPPLGYSPLPDGRVLLPGQSDLTISPTPACCHHLISYIALLDPDFFRTLIAQPDMTTDDKNCAVCVLDKHFLHKGV